MLAVVVLVQALLLRNKCRVLCMSSTGVCRLLVGMLCVRLRSVVGHDLLLVSSVLLFLVLLLPPCSSPSWLLQEVCCCSCLPIQAHSSLLCWCCCVQERTLCSQPSKFLLVEVVDAVGSPQRSCWSLLRLQEVEDRPRIDQDVGAALLCVVNVGFCC